MYLKQPPPLVVAAKKRLLQIQIKYNEQITPKKSSLFGAMWRSSLETDPEGNGLAFLLDDFEERLKPMPN